MKGKRSDDILAPKFGHTARNIKLCVSLSVYLVFDKTNLIDI